MIADLGRRRVVPSDTDNYVFAAVCVDERPDHLVALLQLFDFDVVVTIMACVIGCLHMHEAIIVFSTLEGLGCT